MTKHPFFLLLLPLLGLTNFARAGNDIPAPTKFSHYEAMLKRSPFAVATASAPVGTTPDFARDLYVANAAHSVDGDFVTIASTTDKNLKEYLSTKGPVDGYSISNIQWSDRVGETKVTITKGGQFATLTFNEALLSQSIQNPVVPMTHPPQGIPPNRNIPGRPNPNVRTQIQRPMPVPRIPTPPPHTRPIIRHNIPNQPLEPNTAAYDDSDLERP